MKTAIVTGSNKGIGLEILKGILKIQEYKCVIMAVRSLERGEEAKATLNTADQGRVDVRELDISSSDSISSFVSSLAGSEVDVLINNAAMAFKGADPTPFREQARPTIHTNYHGTVQLTQLMIPLLKANSRIVNVASFAGSLRIMPDEEKKNFALSTSESNKVSVEELSVWVDKFVSDVESGKHADNGWPNTCYGMSKLSVIAYTRLLAGSDALTSKSVVCNAMCPGYCATDMSSHKGPRSAAKGAETAIWLATAPEMAVETGGFYQDLNKMEW